MKAYVKPLIEMNLVETGDIMSGSGESSFLNTQSNGTGGSIDFERDMGLSF